MPQGNYSSGLGLTKLLRSGARGLPSRSPRSSICGRRGLLLGSLLAQSFQIVAGVGLTQGANELTLRVLLQYEAFWKRNRQNLKA